MRLQVELDKGLLAELDGRCGGFGVDRSNFIRILIGRGVVQDTHVVPIVERAKGQVSIGGVDCTHKKEVRDSETVLERAEKKVPIVKIAAKKGGVDEDTPGAVWDAREKKWVVPEADGYVSME